MKIYELAKDTIDDKNYLSIIDLLEQKNIRIN